MLSFLTGLALKVGIPQRFAKVAVIAALFVGVIALLGIGKCTYDRSIVKQHDAKVEAQIAKADRKADAKAAEERRADDARAVTESQEIKEAINEARQTGTDPRAAYYACVRLQQAARRANKPPADC
jgi:uncharacterized protein YqfA (UPF0365 family)